MSQRFMLKSKIHNATITAAELEYEGSVTIDRKLMEAADILPGEQVSIVDITNGARLKTYVIPGEKDSGVVCANGAAAHLINPGDKVIIMSFAAVDESRVDGFKASHVYVHHDNSIKERKLMVPGEKETKRVL